MKESETTVIDKKTKIPLFGAIGLIGFCTTTVLGLARLMWQQDANATALGVKLDNNTAALNSKLDGYHSDCVSMVDKAWWIADMSEYNHQAYGLTSNHLLPEISEVLRVSRNKQNTER